jgi:hypothetical protein
MKFVSGHHWEWNRPQRMAVNAGAEVGGSFVMAQQRRRTKYETTFEERLAEEARRFKEAAEQQPPGSTARELLLRRARQAETASHISSWLSSSELAPPK